MNISDKTRKLLWGRSGNRCAICRHELSIDKNQNDNESIIGEECHIVSVKENGPRHDSQYKRESVDSYDNLILLCRIHHKQVDDQYYTYSTTVLREIKKNHEKWISERLNDEPETPDVHIKRLKGNKPKYLRRLTTGQEILNIISNASSFQYKHDELQDKYEVEKIGYFLDLVNDCDVLMDLSPGQRVELSFDLTKEIEKLNKYGFWVFGEVENHILDSNGRKSNWTMAIIEIKRESSNEIIKVKPLQKNSLEQN